MQGASLTTQNVYWAQALGLPAAAAPKQSEETDEDLFTMFG
jgi:hypothetical protein